MLRPRRVAFYRGLLVRRCCWAKIESTIRFASGKRLPDDPGRARVVAALRQQSATESNHAQSNGHNGSDEQYEQISRQLIGRVVEHRHLQRMDPVVGWDEMCDRAHP